MDQDKFVRLLQKGVAERSIGSSTLRNQGAAGMIEVARKYLGKIRLETLQDKDKNGYLKWLNEHTEKLMKKFPEGGNNNWGAARKALNIFMRNTLYNRWLYKKYKLTNIKSYLEVPLDNDVAVNLQREKPANYKLDKWPKIKYLNLKISNQYQNVAETIAKTSPYNFDRVHLDFVYYRKRD